MYSISWSVYISHDPFFPRLPSTSVGFLLRHSRTSRFACDKFSWVIHSLCASLHPFQVHRNSELPSASLRSSMMFSNSCEYVGSACLGAVGFSFLGPFLHELGVLDCCDDLTLRSIG